MSEITVQISDTTITLELHETPDVPASLEEVTWPNGEAVVWPNAEDVTWPG